MLIHHTDCGMQTLTDDGFEPSSSKRPASPPPSQSSHSPTSTPDVRQSILRLRRSEFLLHRDRIRGFVYDVDTHRLREIAVEGEG